MIIFSMDTSDGEMHRSSSSLNLSQEIEDLPETEDDVDLPESRDQLNNSLNLSQENEDVMDTREDQVQMNNSLILSQETGDNMNPPEAEGGMLSCPRGLSQVEGVKDKDLPVSTLKVSTELCTRDSHDCVSQEFGRDIGSEQSIDMYGLTPNNSSYDDSDSDEYIPESGDDCTLSQNPIRSSTPVHGLTPEVDDEGYQNILIGSSADQDEKLQQLLRKNHMQIQKTNQNVDSFFAATIAQLPNLKMAASELRQNICDGFIEWEQEIIDDYCESEFEIDGPEKVALFHQDVLNVRERKQPSSRIVHLLPLMASNILDMPSKVFNENGFNTINTNSETVQNDSKCLFYVNKIGSCHFDYCLPIVDRSTDDNNLPIVDRDPDDSDPNVVLSSMLGRQSRVRKRNPGAWQDSTRKRLRNSGHSYVGKNGQHHDKKLLGSGCGYACNKKCHSQFTGEERERIFHGYWKLEDIDRQRGYIVQHVSKITAKRHRRNAKADKKGRPKKSGRRSCQDQEPENASASSPSRRKYSHQYFLTVDERKVQVCQVFFLQTLGINAQFVKRSLAKVQDGFVIRDCRGHHIKKIVDPSLVEDVCNHIKSFVPVPSHYCRKNSNRTYLPGQLSIAAMYRMYRDLCLTNGKNPVIESTYHRIFVENFNISFHSPKKDLCSLCEKYRNSEQKNELQDMYEKHLQRKEEARTLKSEHKEMAKNSSHFFAACFDLQQVLPCPYGQNSLFYYKRKLDLYNLSFYSMGDNKVDCMMWDQTTAKRGANEIGSCLIKILSQKASDGSRSAALYADNCGGQNKNRFVLAALCYVVKHTDMERVALCFLERGHTQNENDSVHAIIEKSKKRQAIISTPQQYFTLVRGARKSKAPFEVHEMSADDFFNVKRLAEKLQTSKDESGNKIRWRDIRILAVEKDSPHKAFFAYGHNDKFGEMNLAGRLRQRTGAEMHLEKLRNKPIPVSDAKYKDLISLCEQNAIPPAYHQYYRNLPHGNGCDDIDDGACDSSSDIE